MTSLRSVMRSLLAALALVQATTATAVERPRVIVSTDAGGTDYDDLQSLVHLLLYADTVEIEGLISSPYGAGRVRHIEDVIDVYARDYPTLVRRSAGYPAADALRRVTFQGAIDSAGAAGVGEPTAGSRRIVECARRDDPRPLWVLVWGGIEDVAQALHDAPEIRPRLRVHFIGGPNKKWSAPAYDFIVREHPDLWIIESNSTYRGWFVGGDQAGDLGNEAFMTTFARGRGALGDYFARGIAFRGEPQTRLKMGDSPSLALLLHGDADDPGHESWGGKFVRAWDRERLIWRRLPTAADAVETFRVVEVVLDSPTAAAPGLTASLDLAGQPCPGFRDIRGAWHFWLCPKESRRWRFVIASDDPAIAGAVGEFCSEPAPAGRRNEPSPTFPHWWTDDPDPAVAEGLHQGAKTVNCWRRDFLTDFAERLARCVPGER